MAWEERESRSGGRRWQNAFLKWYLWHPVTLQGNADAKLTLWGPQASKKDTLWTRKEGKTHVAWHDSSRVAGSLPDCTSTSTVVVVLPEGGPGFSGGKLTWSGVKDVSLTPRLSLQRLLPTRYLSTRLAHPLPNTRDDGSTNIFYNPHSPSDANGACENMSFSSSPKSPNGGPPSHQLTRYLSLANSIRLSILKTVSAAHFSISVDMVNPRPAPRLEARYGARSSRERTQGRL
jgi:hypothetical protein